MAHNGVVACGIRPVVNRTMCGTVEYPLNS